MRRLLAAALAMTALLPATAEAARDPSLRGSPASMVRQHDVAVRRAYTFVEDSAEVRKMVDAGKLVPLAGGPGYELARVSYPFARPDVRAFVERLAPVYQAECGEALVVTSLTRPQEQQPGNAHALSVHPAGMAVDFRISRTPACRDWLEEEMLALEKQGLVDITRERHPPHYHVAVFPGAAAAFAKRHPAPPPAAAMSRDSAMIVPVAAQAPRDPALTEPQADGYAPPAEASGGGVGHVAIWAVLAISVMGLLYLLARAVRQRAGAHL